MRLPGRLKTWLVAPVRTPGRAALTLAVLAVLGAAGWFGGRAWAYDRDLTAARAALAAYDFPEARARLAACLALRPAEPEPHLLAAQAARRDGDLDAAAAHLDRYRDLAGSTPEGTLEGAMQKAARGRVPEVLAFLMARADANDPALEQILEALAVGTIHLYQFDRAGFWVGQLLTRAPANPVGLLIRAQTTETLGSRDRATALMRELVEAYPRFVRGRSALAFALYRARQYDEAAGHYDLVRAGRPDDPAPVLGLVRCRLGAGRPDDARPLLRELEGRFGGSSESLLECGKFAVADGRPADGERLLRRAAELAPNDHEVQLHLGVALAQVGKADEARELAARARRVEADMAVMEKLVEATVKAPRDPAPRAEIGRICLRNGQPAEALRWLSGAADLDPASKPVQAALADAYEAVGDAARAAEHRRRAR